MTCWQYQKRILDALAAGEATLPDVVVEHKQNCGACEAYYELQSSFFRRLEEGMKAIANGEVPPSLVPRVRARLDEEPSSPPWMPGWGMAAVAAAVLAVSLGSAFWYRPKLQSVVSETATGALQGVESPVEVTRQPEAPRPSLRHEPRRLRARAFSHGGEDFEALPEVMVFPEERAAFARFVAELPREQEEAVALTGAAPSNDELTAEIMALEIESLEVKSLDPGWE